MDTEKITEDIQAVQDNIREIKSTWGNTIMTLDNIKSGLKADVQKKGDEAYQRGYEDGKDSVVNGCDGCRYSLRFAKDEPCKSCSNCYKSKYAPMPKEDDRIEGGDEVEWDNDFTGDRFIVTRIYQPYGKKEQCDGIDDDGDVYRAVLIESLVKTGRHFDIASILEDMRTHD